MEADLAGAGEIDSKSLPAAEKSFEFDKDIKPLLEATCVKCHSGAKPKGAFSLESRELLLKGGKDDKAIVVGDSAHSTLIRYVARLDEDTEMPPRGKGTPLTPKQVGLLRAWIDAGAKWPDGVKLAAVISEDEKKSVAPEPAGRPLTKAMLN